MLMRKSSKPEVTPIFIYDVIMQFGLPFEIKS